MNPAIGTPATFTASEVLSAYTGHGNREDAHKVLSHMVGQNVTQENTPTGDFYSLVGHCMDPLRNQIPELGQLDGGHVTDEVANRWLGNMRAIGKETFQVRPLKIAR